MGYLSEVADIAKLQRMRGKIKRAWLLLTILSFFTVGVWGPSVAASGLLSPAHSASTEIDGPLHLAVSVSPPIGTPRDTITLTLVLTNNQEEAANAEVSIQLPPSLASRGQRFPAGTTFNFRENQLNWLPVVPAGESEELSVSFTASVADLAQPQRTITVRLMSGEQGAGQPAAQEASVTFWTGLPPTASVSTVPGVVTVGEPVQLQANISGPGPFTQSWALGDGRHVIAQNPVVFYAEPGSYDVALQVANPLGLARARGRVLVVAEPTAVFTIDDEQPAAQQPVTFHNESGGQPPLSYHWEFGDGSSSNRAHPTHQFTEPGTYEVRLLVQSEYGEAETSRQVTVGLAPVADVILDETGATGRPFHAQAYTDDSAAGVHWQMGDGHSYEGEAVSHVYRQPGDYLVTMTTANEFGESRIERQIHVEIGDLFVFLPYVNGEGEGPLPLVTAPGPPAGEVVTLPDAPPAAAPAPVVVAPTPESAGGAGALEEPPPTPAPTSPVDGVVLENGSPDAVAQPQPVPANPAPEQPAPAQPPAPQPPPQPAPAEPFEVIALPQQAELEEGATPAEQLLWFINEARRLHGLPPLAYNYELSIAAQLHTADMAANPEIMHDGSDGSRPAQRQRRYGYGGAYGGEAVAWGWESAVPVVEFWVNSPPHRAIILNPGAREVGVGFTADGTAPNLWYWAAEFGE